jgi:hypothetical protein
LENRNPERGWKRYVVYVFGLGYEQIWEKETPRGDDKRGCKTISIRYDFQSRDVLYSKVSLIKERSMKGELFICC